MSCVCVCVFFSIIPKQLRPKILANLRRADPTAFVVVSAIEHPVIAYLVTWAFHPIVEPSVSSVLTANKIELASMKNAKIPVPALAHPAPFASFAITIPFALVRIVTQEILSLIVSPWVSY